MKPIYVNTPLEARNLALNKGHTRRQLIVRADAGIDLDRLARLMPDVQCVRVGCAAANDYNDTVAEPHMRLNRHTLHTAWHGQDRYWPLHTPPADLAHWLGTRLADSNAGQRTVTKTIIREPDWTDCFADWKSLMRWLVQVEWVRTIPANEKDGMRMREWRFADRCPEPKPGLPLRKMAHTIMLIATGMADGKTPHSMLDGDTRWDVAQGPDAPRVHTRTDVDGTIIITRIGGHEDTRK